MVSSSVALTSVAEAPSELAVVIVVVTTSSIVVDFLASPPTSAAFLAIGIC